MAAPLPLPGTSAVPTAPAFHESSPLSSAAPLGVAPDATATDQSPIDGELAYWAEGLLSAVIAADSSEEAEPVLAAAGNAATAALLLVQYHQRHDGDLRELLDVSADQLAIVRELLHTAPGGIPAAGPATCTPNPVPAPTASRDEAPRKAHRQAASRLRRRRLRLVRSSAR